MTTPEGDWQVACGQGRFEECQKDEKFAYIVALGRAVNSLNFVYSAMLCAGTGDSPDARRARLNSYLFASAILYEGLKLVRAMNQTFKQDEVFQEGLHNILRDKVAQTIEQAHLNPARNRAVFHFLPEFFAEMIASASCEECLFVSAHGKRRRDLYYPFADVITAGILVGLSSDTEEFSVILGKAMSDTTDLMIRFIDGAELLIAYHINRWGFEAKEISPPDPPSPASPKNQSLG
jgi:hypothetical protein